MGAALFLLFLILFFAVMVWIVVLMNRRLPPNSSTAIARNRWKQVRMHRPPSRLQKATSVVSRRVLGAPTDRMQRAAAADEAMDTAGFGDRSGLELVAVGVEADHVVDVSFVLLGTPSDIDRSLAAAKFTTSTSPGVLCDQAPLAGVDPVEWLDSRSGEDSWESLSGQNVRRLLVRGSTARGLDLIHVWVFA